MAEDQGEDSPPVVGIGGSAGGLDAFQDLLEELPAETGVAYVFVSHLAPDQESHVAETLAKHTGMPVEQARDGVRVEPDHLYVLPPDASIRLEDGVLRLGDAPPRSRPSNVVDILFASLADDLGPRCAGVVLSGTLSDGTTGLREIRSAGGFTLAQDPHTTMHPSMPESAIQSGLVDRVDDPAGLGRELARLGRDVLTRDDLGDRDSVDEDHLPEIFDIVLDGVGVDFSRYKKATVGRRLHRRMLATGVGDVGEYVEQLRQDPDEVVQLYHEFLIQVTGFFRDPETFEALEEEVIPDLLEDRDGSDPIRVWVPACATGEEAYSIAILLAEAMEREGTTYPVQIFATDVSEHAVRSAREAHYPKAIEADVSQDRLDRFFTEEDGGFRVHKRIRGNCIFATQDITRDPPFSQMDLISCRNLLIYLEPELQKRVVTVLHYALKKDGRLLVGESESLSRFSDVFQPADTEHQLYRRREIVSPLVRGFEPKKMQQRQDTRDLDQPTGWSDDRLRREADRVLLDRYVPASVLVNADLEIVEFRGEVERYLKHGTGDPSLKLMNMAREGLRVDLNRTIQEVQETRDRAVLEDVHIRQPDGSVAELSVEVIPVQGPGTESPSFLILFHDQDEPETPARGRPEPKRGFWERLLGRRRDEEIERLEEELEATRDYLQSVVEEYEATTEELRSANEEALSTNEELQSTNEELQTAKEELQSTNEELKTLNEELQDRNEEIQRVNNDLINLLESVEMPIVMLGEDLKIRRFTPRAEDDLNLIPTDVGRPIMDIRLPLDVDDLGDEVFRVVQDLQHTEMETRHEDGRRFSLRITPYQTGEKKVEGAVLTFRPLEHET